MKKPTLKLKEIIWEITGKCLNNCSYCGSKDIWKHEINNETIISIATAIAEYPLESVNISGGDPLLVPYGTHELVVKTLNASGIKEVKIIINPKSFLHIEKEKIYSILKLYSWVGVSINNEEELNLYEKHLKGLTNKSTIISNFNIQNIFMFEKIKNLVKSSNVLWQIQYTIFTPKHDLALYENDEANKLFYTYIENALKEGVGIIIADNMNNTPCAAGINSIGILSNGDVVPCLSMRSWENNISKCVEGNLLTEKLKYIWEYKFLNNRFTTTKCCKDFCNNKCYQPSETPIFNELFKLIPKEESITKYPPNWDRVVLYGVTPNIQMYGVGIHNTVVYAVFSNQGSLT